MLRGHLTAQAPEVEGCFEEMVDGRQALVAVGTEVPLDPVEYLLGGGQATGGLDHEDLVRGGLDQVQFPV